MTQKATFVQTELITRKILLSEIRQVQVVEVEVEEELTVWDLEKKSKRKDTLQKGSKLNRKIYIKMRTDRNYSIFQYTYRPDLLTLLPDVIHESEESQTSLHLN